MFRDHPLQETLWSKLNVRYVTVRNFIKLHLIEIIKQTKGKEVKMVVPTIYGSPPPPSISPKSNKKLKLLDIDPLELARQLTLMESDLYQKIKPMECLQRAREQRTENVDNITTVIQTSNRVGVIV